MTEFDRMASDTYAAIARDEPWVSEPGGRLSDIDSTLVMFEGSLYGRGADPYGPTQMGHVSIPAI